jgi:hypothetical protein
MSRSIRGALLAPLWLACAAPSTGNADGLEAVRAEIAALRADYETRIQTLQNRIDQLQAAASRSATSTTGGEAATAAVAAARASGNAFNPAMSVILDGHYASYSRSPADRVLPGTVRGGEAGLRLEGLGLGHAEMSLSASVDPLFQGRLTLAVAEHDGAPEVELEEAWVQTLGLGGGASVRAGRMLSAVGYLNQQHDHATDFADAPLVYEALFGGRYIDDGVRASWIAPADVFLEAGVELLRGARFPGGGEPQGAASRLAFLTLGGDAGPAHSWQIGASHLRRTLRDRAAAGHSHGAQEALEVPVFAGDGRVTGVHGVWKWMPGGAGAIGQVKLQGEYFRQHEAGEVVLEGSQPLEASTLRGGTSGYYLQSTWRFARAWQAAVRFERLRPDNTGSEPDLLEEAGLLAFGVAPERRSLMLEWLPSEFSRLRLQLNREDAGRGADHQVLVHYTFSLGDHQAHPF